MVPIPPLERMQMQKNQKIENKKKISNKIRSYDKNISEQKHHLSFCLLNILFKQCNY